MNQPLHTTIAAILFVASKPLTTKQIARKIAADESAVVDAVEVLKARYNQPESGIHIFGDDGGIQMGTNPACAEAVDLFVSDEVAGELTKAQLETLTVVAYRGPITRPELEEIRGVNCSVILRNLMIRGLVEQVDDPSAILPPYALTTEALRHLGVTSVSELPEYDVLRQSGADGESGGDATD